MPSALEMIGRDRERETRERTRMQEASLPCSRKLSNVSFEKKQKEKKKKEKEEKRRRGPIERFVLYDA